MRHRNKNKILDRKKEPREMMLRNLVSSILIYERVETTLAKAKVVRPMLEKTISVAKKGDLASRRKLISLLPQKLAVKKAMEVIGQKYEDRNGGYSRIVKTGNRQGDGAPMALIELV